jgi:hypothetical protein
MKLILLLFFICGASSFANVPEQFAELVFNRRPDQAIAMHEDVVNYFNAHPSEAPAFVDRFLERIPSANPKSPAMEKFIQSFELVRSLTDTNPEFKNQEVRKLLRSRIESLLARFRNGFIFNKTLEFMDTMWLWNASDLDFLMSRIKHGYLNQFSTQTIYVFSLASEESRLRFLDGVRELKNAYKTQTWFGYALAYEVHLLQPDEEVQFLKYLSEMSEISLIPPEKRYEVGFHLRTSRELLLTALDDLHKRFQAGDPLLARSIKLVENVKSEPGYVKARTYSTEKFRALLRLIHQSGFPYGCRYLLSSEIEDSVTEG